MTGVQVTDVAVEVDYGQLYARRAGAAWASDQVPSVGYEERLWTDGSFVYVGTAKQYGTTPVRVEVLEHAPDGDASAGGQHVAEVSLVAGGDLGICSWGEEEPDATVAIPGGPVRLRATWTGLDAERADDDDSEEAILLQVWPAEVAPAQVVRWWDEWALPPPSDTAPDGHRQVEGLERVLERLPDLQLIARLGYPYPAMPGGGEHSSINAVYLDPGDGSRWVDGYDGRRMLREVAEVDADSLVTGGE